MVWCHQVRWRIARAAIELTKATTSTSRGVALDFWLRDGHLLPPGLPEQETRLIEGEGDARPQGQTFVLKNPARPGRYLLPVPRRHAKFVLYLSQGSITPTAPHRPLPLRAFIHICNGSHECKTLPPTSLRLLPSPIPGRPFPIAQEGSDESEGVVMYEKELLGDEGSVSVTIGGTDGRGWLLAGFVQSDSIVENASALGESFHHCKNGKGPIDSSFSTIFVDCLCQITTAYTPIQHIFSQHAVQCFACISCHAPSQPSVPKCRHSLTATPTAHFAQFRVPLFPSQHRFYLSYSSAYTRICSVHPHYT